MVHRPTEAALKSRARALVERMGAAERWVYAVPPDEETAARNALAARGLREASPGVFVAAEGDASVTLSPRPELAVLLVEARGAAAAPVLAEVLGVTSMYAQSTLLAHAHDEEDEERAMALATLATMAVAWDAAWETLFRLHLEDAEPEARAAAASSLVIAATTAGEAAPAMALLDAALAREADEATRAAIAAARARLGAP